MNINKHLILLFSVLFFLFAVSVSSGCFRKNESDVKSVVRNELDQLKNLDSETTQKYIPYTELFPDATENTDLTDEINKTFSLFFQGNLITKFRMSSSAQPIILPLFLSN